MREMTGKGVNCADAPKSRHLGGGGDLTGGDGMCGTDGGGTPPLPNHGPV